MKKSEFERARTALWKSNLETSTETAEVILMVMRDGEAAEAAGVVWDPEEPEMAERLCVAEVFPAVDCSISYPYQKPCALAPVHGRTGWATAAECQAAADLYNRRKDIAAVAADLRLWRGHPIGAEGFERWADLLEGKKAAGGEHHHDMKTVTKGEVEATYPGRPAFPTEWPCVRRHCKEPAVGNYAGFFYCEGHLPSGGQRFRV